MNELGMMGCHDLDERLEAMPRQHIAGKEL